MYHSIRVQVLRRNFELTRCSGWSGSVCGLTLKSGTSTHTRTGSTFIGRDMALKLPSYLGGNSATTKNGSHRRSLTNAMKRCLLELIGSLTHLRRKGYFCFLVACYW